MCKEICEREEFLSHIDADQYTRLLSRDDLKLPQCSFRNIRLQIRDAVDQVQEGRKDAIRSQSYRSGSSGAAGHQGDD